MENVSPRLRCPDGAGSVPPRGSNLPATEAGVKTLKSHPRKWVDGSDPAYLGGLPEFRNPTNGSWWMVQIQPVRSPRKTMTEVAFECARPLCFGGWI